MAAADVLIVDDFFDRATSRQMLATLRDCAGEAATVYGQTASATIAAAVRRATRITPPAPARDFVMQRLLQIMPEVQSHFGIELRECEEAHFLRYVVGDFFVAHQDGNTPLIRDDSRLRRISVVVFLSESSIAIKVDAHGGGDLLMHGRYPDFDQRTSLPSMPGRLVAFRSETTHEVTPITHGERYTIASWYR